MTILMASCHQNNSDQASYAVAEMDQEMISESRQSADAPLPPMDKIESQDVIKKIIIKDGSIGLRVSELEKAKWRMDTLIKSHGGYYANERFQNTDWESSYTLQIRIPALNFEKLIADIENGDGQILFKEIDARDVTDQFIDLEIRLDNKRNYLNRYNDLLKQAKNVKEILEIEEKIRVLEEEIESTTGRLKYLSDLVDYSTLNLTISKTEDFKYNPDNRDKFSERLKQSLSKGWFGFVDFLLFMIRIWPFWIIVTALVYLWKKYRKSRRVKGHKNGDAKIL
jgi:hypothetical protein